jgi:hypothetical protein
MDGWTDGRMDGWADGDRDDRILVRLTLPGFDPLRDDPRFTEIFDESKPANAPEVPR